MPQASGVWLCWVVPGLAGPPGASPLYTGLSAGFSQQRFSIPLEHALGRAAACEFPQACFYVLTLVQGAPHGTEALVPCRVFVFAAEDEGVPVVLVCGPKNTGKSTFNRYLINLLLNR